MRSLAKRLVLVVGLSALTLSAQAATYNIDGVWNGSSGGFRSSLFHNLDWGPMGGQNIGDVRSAATGTYDSNGTLDLYITIADPANSGNDLATAHLTSSNLVFDSAGWLAGTSQIGVELTSGMIGGSSDAFSLDFGAGQVCCSGPNAPNSLQNNAAGDLWLTLWGSTNYNSGTGHFFGAASGYRNIGLDLRAELSPVPIPGAVWLFGSGLLLLFRMRSRKQA